MRIAILTQNRNLHSIRRLREEARKKKIICDVIHTLGCQIVVDGKQSRILVGSRSLPKYHRVIPRIGASITTFGIAVVKQFELMGVRSMNPSQAIADSRDKMRCLQVLSQAGLKVPTTVLTRSPKNLRPLSHAIGGMPAVLKVLEGTQGLGVMLVNSPISMQSVLEGFWGLDQEVLIQRFIHRSAGRDYRVLVVGSKVVAAMERTAPRGDFRSNIHRGGVGRPIKLPPAYRLAAIKAVKALGLTLAGVDLMESDEGPVILEVNSSPGFEGIEKATGVNVAREIIGAL